MPTLNFQEMWTLIMTFALPVVAAIVIFIAGWIVSRLAADSVRRTLPRAGHFDDTITPLLAQTARYGVLIIALVMALTQLGVQTTSVLAVLGAAGLAIALALQGTLANIAAGVMLIWLRPFAVGDYIDGNNVAGTVIEVGLFATRLKSADGVYVFAPNSQIWNAKLTNYSREATRRLDLQVGIGYESSIDKARTALMGIATTDERVLKDPAPIVYVESLGSSSVDMLLRIWVATSDYWNVKFEFTELIKREFDKNDIEIPYNKLDVIQVNQSAQQT